MRWMILIPDNSIFFRVVDVDFDVGDDAFGIVDELGDVGYSFWAVFELGEGGEVLGDGLSGIGVELG